MTVGADGEPKVSRSAWATAWRWLRLPAFASILFALFVLPNPQFFFAMYRHEVGLLWSIVLLGILLFLVAAVSRQAALIGDAVIAFVIEFGKPLRAWLFVIVPLASSAALLAAAYFVPQLAAARLLRGAELRATAGVPKTIDNAILEIASQMHDTRLFVVSRDVLAIPEVLDRKSQAILRATRQEDQSCFFRHFPRQREITERRSVWGIELPWQNFNEVVPVVLTQAELLETQMPARALQIRENFNVLATWLRKMAQTKPEVVTSLEAFLSPYLNDVRANNWRARYDLRDIGAVLLTCSNPQSLAHHEFMTRRAWELQYQEFSSFLRAHIREILTYTEAASPSQLAKIRDRHFVELVQKVGAENATPLEKLLSVMWARGVAGGSWQWETEKRARAEADRIHPLPKQEEWVDPAVAALLAFGMIEERSLEAASAAETFLKAVLPVQSEGPAPELVRMADRLPYVPAIGLYPESRPFTIPYNRGTVAVQRILGLQDAALILLSAFFVWLVSGVCFRVGAGARTAERGSDHPT